MRSQSISKGENALLMEKWVESIRTYMPDFPQYLGRFRICQLHFDPEDMTLTRGQMQLRNGAIPKLFPFEA